MIDNTRIYLSPPHMSGHELAFVKEAFDTNWIAPLGPQVKAFEEEVCAYTGIKGAVALSSGTAAIHLALRLLGVGHDDLVFCSSLTFIGSVNPALYLGARPVFIDSEPDSWNMSSVALKKAFAWAVKAGKLPRAVIVVNLYGQSADLDPLLDICSEYEVPVIEDAAESLGATYKGKSSGTLGEFGIFSFNGNKIITTSGGGMLVSNDTEALDKALFWATQARDAAQYYQHSDMGYNYRMSNVLAAIGRGQLLVLDDRIKKRRAIWKHYADNLQDIAGIGFMPEAPFGISNRWLTVLTIDPDKIRLSPGQVVEQLERHNIESRPLWKPMHLQPLFSGCTYFTQEETASVSEKLFNTGLCIPSGSSLTREDQDIVITALKKCINI